MTKSPCIRVILVASFYGLVCLHPSDNVGAQVAASEPIQALAKNAEGKFIIRGQCMNSDLRKPESGVQLSLFANRDPEQELQLIRKTKCNDQGEFEFTQLEAPNQIGQELLSYTIVAESAKGIVQIRENLPFFGSGKPVDVWFTNLSIGVSGKVVDSQGKPVPGVRVTQFSRTNHPLRGFLTDVTDIDGRFLISGFSDYDRRDDNGKKVRQEVGFRLIHSKHPIVWSQTYLGEENAVLRFSKHSEIAGLVVDESNTAAAGVRVTADNIRSGGNGSALTDGDGRFRIVVESGNYHVWAEARARVSVAITDVECQAGTKVNIDPIKLIRGGFISGRIVNSRTGEILTKNERGDPISVGLFGPSRPMQKSISATPVVEVDNDGRFMMRAAPGKNYPYLVNMRGDRMAWNTTRQEPIVVAAGKRVRVDMTITPELSDSEKMAIAKKAVDALPQEPKQRTARILDHFRQLNHTVDETELWCSLMKELVAIGDQATLQLIEELDETEAQRMIRRLGFAFRAIKDPRAVPALIRNIPKTLQPPMSDYGLIVKDGDLAKFMNENDIDPDRGGEHFSFARPVREVFHALHKISGHKFDDEKLFRVHRSDRPAQQVLQRQLFQTQAKRWQEWWNDNWMDFTNDPEFGPFELSFPEESIKNQKVNLAKGARIGRGGLHGMTLTPVGLAGTHFLDLDTGLDPKLPQTIAERDLKQNTPEFKNWVKRTGVDLMCIVQRADDGAEAFALQRLNLKIWEIEIMDVRNLEKRLREKSLKLDRPLKGDLLLHFDKETQTLDKDANAAFVYETDQGSMGVLEITDQVKVAKDITGLFQAPKGVGFHKGVRFNNTILVPAE